MSVRVKGLPAPATGAQLAEINRVFYDALWRDARLVEPSRFNTWPIASALAARAPRRLEVAPGLRPRLPVEGTHFVDLSAPAVAALRPRAAFAARGAIGALPFADASFDLVCALDIVEHVEDDAAAFAELARVAADRAALLLSVPLHPAQWTAFDAFVGHHRRYDPSELLGKLAAHGFAVERSAVFGMQPKSSWLLDLGLWFLIHQRKQAMWWYNRVGMPLATRLQKPLRLSEGMIDDAGVDEVLLLCRKRGAGGP